MEPAQLVILEQLAAPEQLAALGQPATPARLAELEQPALPATPAQLEALEQQALTDLLNMHIFIILMHK